VCLEPEERLPGAKRTGETAAKRVKNDEKSASRTKRNGNQEFFRSL
jgi:hypothetical protein